MSAMICGYCGKPGIHWENLAGLTPYTICPHCGGTNCQVPEDSEDNLAESDKDAGYPRGNERAQ